MKDGLELLPESSLDRTLLQGTPGDIDLTGLMKLELANSAQQPRLACGLFLYFLWLTVFTWSEPCKEKKNAGTDTEKPTAWGPTEGSKT